MGHALRAFISDLFSSIVFLVVFAVTGDALLTMIVAIGVGAAQIAVEKIRGRPVQTMQWLSLGLVLVFGSVSLVTHDMRFIMMKPTLIHFAVGAVMLKRGWLDRYLPEIVHDNVPQRVIVASGYAWSALMFVVGIANFLVAMRGDRETWALFNSVVPMGANFAAFGVQYLVLRAVVSRKLRQAAPEGA